MIREATLRDGPAIERLLRETHDRSKYSTRAKMNDRALTMLVTAMIAGQHQNGPQATYVVVSEKCGKVVGFMMGVLNRVYNVLDRLVANDVFLINEGASVADTQRMIDGYIEWARSNPKVIEIGLSWSDAVKGGDVIAKIYQRKGFKLVGEQYELRIDVAERKAA